MKAIFGTLGRVEKTHTSDFQIYLKAGPGGLSLDEWMKVREAVLKRLMEKPIIVKLAPDYDVVFTVWGNA